MTPTSEQLFDKFILQWLDLRVLPTAKKDSHFSEMTLAAVTQIDMCADWM